MSSLLNATTRVLTTTPLPAHIAKPQVLAFLHDNKKMLALNPIVKSYTLLPDASSIAFFKSVPSANKPPATGPEAPIPVYAVVEAMGSGPDDAAQADSWRGGWAKRFVPDEIAYETSLQSTEKGMISITHAPMGVHSCTVWEVVQQNGGLEVKIAGEVTSNRMLMTFIKTTLQDSYEKLARDFKAALENEIAGVPNGAVV